MLAVITFLFTNIFGTKEYWKEIFWPDVPTWLKAPVPMMPLIEFFGIFTKPFALMIRLFANIMAGHAAILSLIAIIFITVKVGPVINGSMTVVAVAFGIFMDCIGNSGCIHPGVCVYDAVGSLYRIVACKRTRSLIIE